MIAVSKQYYYLSSILIPAKSHADAVWNSGDYIDAEKVNLIASDTEKVGIYIIVDSNTQQRSTIAKPNTSLLVGHCSGHCAAAELTTIDTH